MIEISLCMIVKNEEDVIGRCLESVKDIADEINIIDTGSVDRTKEEAQKYTDRIFDFDWIDDFAAARNFSFSKATKPYILWLDADDVILAADRNAFLELKNSLREDTDFVMMKYNTAFDTDGTPTVVYYRERLMKNDSRVKWLGAVHEVITPYGNIEYSDIAVTHKKMHPADMDRNLRIFEKVIRDGGVLDPRQQFYYARELYYHKRYREAVDVIKSFLDSGRGWVENCIDACQQMAYCYYGLGEPKNALAALLRSFEFDEPRAEICCDIGLYFFDYQRYETAVFWYKLALDRERRDTGGGFVSIDCYGYIPCLQLCVCFDRLGDRKLAKQYNDLAAMYKPESPAVLFNKKYFASIE